VSAHAGAAPVFRDMAVGDIPEGLRLSRASGWNQTEADWQLLLTANPGRFVVAVRDGRVFGTAGAAAYPPRLAWVCMVLVDPAERGHGVGEQLVRCVLERVADLEAVGLDATPQGQAVYARLDFSPVASLARMGGIARAFPAPARADVRPVRDADLPAVFRLDHEAFGADRSVLLRSALARAPALAWWVREAGALVGYCFGRSGDHSDHIGPVVARHLEAASALVSRALASVAGRPVILDASTSAPEWPAFLEVRGLRTQRTFTRMYRSGARPQGRTELEFAIRGPEFG
jgi:predicted N-acetyltransferase YhbS